MFTVTFAFLGIVTLIIFSIFLLSPFVDLISDWVKNKEEKKEHENEKKLKALLYYVNHTCRRA